MKIEWKFCFKLAISAFILFLCINYWNNVANALLALLSAVAPLWIGGIIAYIINILMSFYERHYFTKTTRSKIQKSRRPVCIIAAFATLIAILSLLINLVIPELVSCIQLLIRKLPSAMEILNSGLASVKLIPEKLSISLSTIDWESKITQSMSILTSGFGNVVGSVAGAISSVFSGIVTTLVSIIFSIYLLTGKEKLSKQISRLLKHYTKKKFYKKTLHILNILNHSFHNYIVGQCTEAVILGILCIIGMLILRLPYAVMIGSLISFTALIPIAGAFIGAGVGAIMILTVSPIKALIFLIFIVVLQQLEGNIIYPRVVGASMGLPAIWVFTAVTVGGGIMGIAGMLLGVPLAATLYELLREDLNKKS